jgi:TatD DNase family protein
MVDGDPSNPEELQGHGANLSSNVGTSSNLSHAIRDASTLPKETLNHPANIQNVSASCFDLHSLNAPVYCNSVFVQ